MYKPVIGLEIHAELKTKTKMFCDSLNDPDEKHPNINVCPICMGHPGTLPVINYEAVKKVIMAGLALNCKIAEDTFFERKNYFYPDLPKGYQITQYQKPLCENGHLDLSSSTNAQGSKRIRITRIHLEEDAGRLYHLPGKDYSLVDYNRAGMPLMELVTEPDLETGLEVKKFAEELQLILRYLGVSDADMEKGQLRIEVNISLRPELPITNYQLPIKLGTKVEIKNLNSIKAASDSVDHEIKRQTELLEAGEKVVQETRGWDDSKKATVSQRSKEEAHDYRYFPEPDLPPLKFTLAQIEAIREGLPELPSQRRVRFALYGLTEAQIEIFSAARHLGDYYEHVATELDSSAKDFHIKKGLKGEFSKEQHLERRLHELSANYIITEFPALMSASGTEIDDLEGFKISSEAFAELMVLIFHRELSSTGAKAVLKEMAETGMHPEQIMRERNLGQMSNPEELESAVDKVIAKNSQAVEDYKKGKEASLKFLMGMVMRESGGKANPQVVEEILKKKLQ
ncbi:MAG: Asp-tRNA(Asn)/Glu-tRNA(Gln) amidotransferase subunit GatB [Candidatus Yanofskybacteria bacterium]|nr:Asp-tRNA(Asn)/Glu-tRNA(Gln) amidotransferase subunit GatB [Candidatus Yanofskybacteria bacterium]